MHGCWLFGVTAVVVSARSSLVPAATTAASSAGTVKAPDVRPPDVPSVSAWKGTDTGARDPLAVSLKSKVDLPPADPAGVIAESVKAAQARVVGPAVVVPRALDVSGSAPEPVVVRAVRGDVGVSSKRVLVGDGTVSVEAPDSASVGSGRDVPASVTVEVLASDVASKIGSQGVGFTVARADGVTGPGRVRVRVDVRRLALGFGADWEHRARFVRWPACVLTTPEIGRAHV